MKSSGEVQRIVAHVHLEKRGLVSRLSFLVLCGLTLAFLLAPFGSTPTAHAAQLSGLHVQGNALVNRAGQRVLLHGVNRDGTDYACEEGWGMSDGPVNREAMQAIASWHANAVRILLNEHCWLGLAGIKPALRGAAYQKFIAQEVSAATAAGLYVILDLHISGPKSAQGFVSGIKGQQPMADLDYSPAFWTQVASAYKHNPAVLFDLFNEPFAIDWACWKNGCQTKSTGGTSYQTAGMQTLVNAVRQTGAPNVVLLGGIRWAGDESSWAASKPADALNNLAVSYHRYNFGNCNSSACWDGYLASDLAHVQSTYPVVAGEFGTTDCSTTFINSAMNWMDGQHISYLAWTWDTWGNCQALISNYNGTPTSPYGMAYSTHLALLQHTR